MADTHLRSPAADGASDPVVKEHRVAVRGIELAYFEWGPRVGPTILMLHATGFHARCWDGVIRAITRPGGVERATTRVAPTGFPGSNGVHVISRAARASGPPHGTGSNGVHVIAVDQRGHGRSTKAPPYDWGEFGTDAAALIETLDLDDIVGVGHSMGGHAIVQAAGKHADRFRALLLVDPVILDPAAHAMPAPFRSTEDHPVSRRRNRWASAEEMFERFKDRHPFSVWKPNVLMDYCRFGIVPDGDGFVLACPPQVEAAIYLGSAGRDIRATIGKVTKPVVVLRARERASPARRDTSDARTLDFARSPTWPGLAAAFMNGHDVHYPELTHFMPMQAPDLVARHICEICES